MPLHPCRACVMNIISCLATVPARRAGIGCASVGQHVSGRAIGACTHSHEALPQRATTKPARRATTVAERLRMGEPTGTLQVEALSLLFWRTACRVQATGPVRTAYLGSIMSPSPALEDGHCRGADPSACKPKHQSVGKSHSSPSRTRQGW